jgi:L-erythrulose 1-phosphate isomerase
MSSRTPWIGASWKMNKTRPEARSFAQALAASPVATTHGARLFVIPPFTAIADVAAILAGRKVLVGAQNVHWADAGAWTGEISAPMIREVGARLAEIGHSERRTHFGETDEMVALKTKAAVRAWSHCARLRRRHPRRIRSRTNASRRDPPSSRGAFRTRCDASFSSGHRL